MAVMVESCQTTWSVENSSNIMKSFKKFIDKYGKKALHFLSCMGKSWCENCVEPTLKCLQQQNITGCIALIECEEKSSLDCIHHL